MDVKDSRTESALSERNNDGSKYTQSGGALQCNRNKSYQDIGSNPLAKTEPMPVRPCAVIGPDRVIPPPTSNDAFLKKVSIDPWLSPSPENVYRRPPEYPLKATINQNPSRNISPRQTFQENMQRIMVAPNYNVARHGEDLNNSAVQDRNITVSKNKPSMAPETKYCDVPYTLNTLSNEAKNIRDAEIYVPSVNSPLTRTAPPVWPAGSVNVHAPRTYGAPEIYQYSQYQSCAGPRPTIIPVNRPPRTIQEDPGFVYPEHYYQDPSIRFKPYPHVKEKYPQPRYEYIGNYSSIGPYHPPSPIQPHKYDIPKSGQPHPYSVYPHLKYIDNRIPDHSLEGYQRPTNQQAHYNIPFRNQVIHPTYAPVTGNIPQSKMHPYPPDASAKAIHPNKLAYENSNKMYIDYENSRNKPYPIDNYFVNEMSRIRPPKNQMVMPNYPCIGMPPNQPQHYRKDNTQMRPYDYFPHFRHLEQSINNNTMMRHPTQFSPNTLAISPSDSNASNDTAQTQGTSQDDCGYVSQSSTASVRSIDSGMYKHNEFYKRYDYRYGHIVGNSPTLSKSELNSNENKQKQIDVRQFFQMWNEGEDDNCENTNSKEIVVQTGSSDLKNYQKQAIANQDQLYVLGLVNVPSEELSKYEHIQKISKLPENIKGYNNLELLSQFEEAIESSNKSRYKLSPKEYQMPLKDNIPKQVVEALPRPVSPLDVEAKISQSVIHKEVGCNFEIKPCSPKMMNVEVAAPAQNILAERVIEKISNPLPKMVKSPTPIKPDENVKCHSLKRQEKTFTITDNPSCKMISSPYTTTGINNMDSVKTNYSLQDLEINSGVCLASLPRLDNEIELNFPEVNQQFINANKKDGTSPSNACSSNKLAAESSFNNILDGNDILKCDNSTMLDESEKACTKLIKYRKTKSNPICPPEMNLTAKAIRTDSVIIKNPENIKNIEDKFMESSLNMPMNLTSQSIINHKPNFELADKQNHTKYSDIDIVALDFSLSKPNNGLPIIEIEKDELKKSTTTKLSDIVCENISRADENRGNNNHENNISEHDHKDAISQNIDIITSKCNEKEVSKTASLEDNQGIKNVLEVSFEDELNTVVVKNDDFTSILDNAYSKTLMPKNTLSGNGSLDVDCNHVTDNNIKSSDDQKSPHCEQICSDNENITLNDPDYDKNDSAYEEDIVFNNNTCAERDKSLKIVENSLHQICSIKNVPRDEEPTENLLKDNKSEFEAEKNENNQAMGCQNENINETDEISATLEKIFEDTSDAITILHSKNDTSEASIPKAIKIPCSYQSKELHSPWIQKLLLHNEGLCSLGENGLDKYEMRCYSLKDIQCTEESMRVDTCIAEVAHSQSTGHEDTNENIDTIDHTMSNETYGDNMSQNFTSYQECRSLPLSDNINCQPSTDKDITCSFIENEISPEENPLLKIQLEDTQSKCYAESLIKTDQLKQHVIEIEESELQSNYNHLSDQLENESCISDKPEEVINNEKSDNVREVKTSDGVNNGMEILKMSYDLHKGSVENIALSSDKIPTENKTVSSSYESNETKEEVSQFVNKELENNVICGESKNTSAEDLNTPSLEKAHQNDEIQQTEENQNYNSLITNETLLTNCESDIVKTSGMSNNCTNINWDSDNRDQKDSCTSGNISFGNFDNCENNSEIGAENQNTSILINDTGPKLPDITDHVPDNLSKLNLSSIENESLPFDTITKENKDINDVRLENNSETDHNVPASPVSCENMVESDDYQVVVSGQFDTHTNNTENVKSCHEESKNDYLTTHRLPLKRSYSDSALNNCKKTDVSTKQDIENTPLAWSSKRQKIYELENSNRNVVAENLCSIINNNRRNSVSTFYTEDDVSFCILIDNNCIITEEGEDEKICYTEIEEDCIAELSTTNDEDNINISNEEELIDDAVSDTQENNLHFSDSILLNYDDEKSVQESWLDNVACVETVISDDIAEEVICSSNSSPKDITETIYDASEFSNCIINESVEVNLSNDEDMRVYHHEPWIPPSDDNVSSCDGFEPREILYRDECLERILSEPNSRTLSPSPIVDNTEVQFLSEDSNLIIPEDKENIFVDKISLENDESCIEHSSILRGESHLNKGSNQTEKTPCNMHTNDDVVHSCESSIDNVFNYKQKDEDINYRSSSSPEVSSTTSEEKSSSILLKITNYNGSRISQINEINHNRPRCKFTEKKEYSNSNGGLPNRPLLTKGAQKYIPPLKESIRDLKVQLSLPQQKLLKLKQLKLSKSEPKINNNNAFSTIPKKPKPNFEDVLKSIDEDQIKMHKEKSKKTKHIPKVVIKKRQNGSHYTSSSNKEKFDPDLTGRKWQPWVFLEKNHFIDKMVVRNKTKAIFSHRQNTYVLAEKFKKYKSIGSAKFVITHPNTGDASKGQLKYTIRLKHTY